jgi:ATP-dependent Clp protease ATP-binding subunit ClpA
VQGSQRLARLAARAAHARTSLESLRDVRELQREVDAFERRQVARALAEGATFGQIARALGVTRQAAHRRFRDLAVSEPPLATTDEARLVLGYACEEALALGAGTPGGQHILLASLRAPALPAGAVLRDAGATLEAARALTIAARDARDAGPSGRPRGRRSRELADAELRATLAGAAREAREHGARRIDLAHLLIGALGDEDGGAVRTLRALNVDIETVRKGLAALIKPPSVNSC